MENKFAGCDCGIRVSRNMLEKNRDLITRLAKAIFRWKITHVTSESGMIVIKGWIKTETNEEK